MSTGEYLPPDDRLTEMEAAPIEHADPQLNTAAEEHANAVAPLEPVHMVQALRPQAMLLSRETNPSQEPDSELIKTLSRYMLLADSSVPNLQTKLEIAQAERLVQNPPRGADLDRLEDLREAITAARRRLKG